MAEGGRGLADQLVGLYHGRRGHHLREDFKVHDVVQRLRITHAARAGAGGITGVARVAHVPGAVAVVVHAGTEAAVVVQRQRGIAAQGGLGSRGWVGAGGARGRVVVLRGEHDGQRGGVSGLRTEVLGSAHGPYR
ncbi:hypothetical protein B7Y94_05560 [Candidatus Saccharibacteria bacterium 32-49-12]|nr:MAG: hypothetical protein B7Y94_05560 [Candidatus Saccharibacteria bacterium 32-49-12]